MNANGQFERELEQWLQAKAPASAPAGFHASVMDRARTLRQRPGWAASVLVRQLGRGRGLTLLAAAALLGGAALAAGSGILRLPTVVPPVPAPSVNAVASPDASPGPSGSAAPSASPIPVAGPGGVWIPTGSMVTPHGGEHAAVRLQDGRVLVVGGESRAGDFLSAQLYDPATGTWSATADMPGYAGGGAEAVLLRDGTVLVGESVYDPASGTWSSTEPVVSWSAWKLATVTALRDGKVLATKYGVAKLYDPATGTWAAAAGEMNVRREHAAATLLSDGTVLVAGGTVDVFRLTDSAEAYDPVTGSWTAIANMPAPGGMTATLLRDGKVLVAGTAPAAGGGFQGVARVYDPATGTWTELVVRPGVRFNSAELLTDGTVLLTQSWQAYPGCVTVDLYDPRTGSWTSVSGIPWCNVGSFTPLLDGTVLVAGGSDCNSDGDCVSNGAAALYVPAGVPLPPLLAFPSAPPPVFPSPTATAIPTPRLTPLPAAAGPVPPNARSWTVTVDNRSSEPAALFVADEDGDALRLVGAATPNVVPAGASVKVTFLFPPDGGWIYVNPRPGEGGALVSAADIGIPGKIVVTADGQVGWFSP
jgi:hypothetical protein